MSENHFDVIVIGSGFGGSVTAMRLAQKGYEVAVLEAGRKYGARDFPKSNWNLRKYLWAPLIRCFGFQKITLLRGLMVLHGTGVGGGSLVYANTLMRPDQRVFENPAWPPSIDWNRELSPFYEEARRMLGVTRAQKLGPADQALHEVSQKMGCGDSFHATDVGVYYGSPGVEVSDPYFSGDGPRRSGCVSCGGCMVGCRFGAKNTLDQNYLYFAERWGVRIIPETRVTRIIPDGEGYNLESEKTTAWFKFKRRRFRASKVVIAAGVMGTMDLLLKNRDVHKTLPKISSRLGQDVRTNGESLLGATSFIKDRDYSEGVAIGSAMHPDPVTKIEAVRYPSGSNFMRLLAVPLTGDGNWLTRPLKMCAVIFRRLPRVLRLFFISDWAKSSVILLVMQSIDQKIRLKSRRGPLAWLGLSLKAQHESIPSYIPKAQAAARALADVMQGEPQNVISEVMFQTPATAHVLGGAAFGSRPEEGVINSNHEVFGYPGLYVCDGSVIPSNLAVNPSLTITALAERFSSLWPVKKGASPEDLRSRVIRYGR